MQSFGQSDPFSSIGIRRWHPKLTPYRLLVLGTTIGVGTAKAVAAQEGDGGASTTLEWISGVVIFLILHSMGTYDETPKDPPAFLIWLFTIDCMDYIWRTFSLLRILPPLYSSEPESTPRSDINTHDKKPKANEPPITLYRIFVCVSTVVFGLTKAIMTYSGYSAGANWVDWTLGVVVTSILFILGMYENNSIGMWHTFFVSDFTTETQHGLGAASISFLILGWLGACVWMISLMWTSPTSAFLSTDDVPVPMSSLTTLALLRERLFEACFSLYMALMIAISALSGVLGVAAVLSTSGLPRWADLGEWMVGQRPAWKDGYTALETPGRRLTKKVAYHIVSLTTFLLGCTVYFAFWVVSVAANVEEGYMLLHNNLISNPYTKPDSESDPGYLVFLGITILFQISGAAATSYLMWLVARGMLLPPLSKWRNGEAEWEKDLLF